MISVSIFVFCVLFTVAAVWPWLQVVFSGERVLGLAFTGGPALFLLLFFLVSRVIDSYAIAFPLVLIALAVGGVFGWFYQGRLRSSLREWDDLVWIVVIFSLVTFLRFQFPAITTDPNLFGGEKLFNFQLQQAFLQGESFPPDWLWAPKLPIDYYLLPKALPGLSVWLARAFAGSSAGEMVFVFSDAFFHSLAIVAGASVALMVLRRSVGEESRGHRFLTLTFALCMGFLPYLFFPAREVASVWTGRVDFWGLSRIIAGTINEYPFWTFLFGDNHAHANVMAFQICLWFVYWRLLLKPRDCGLIVLTSVLAVVVALSNSWSVIFDVVVMGFVTVFHLIVHRGDDRGRALGAIGVVALLAGIIIGQFIYFAQRKPLEFYWVPVALRSPPLDWLNVFGVMLLVIPLSLLFLTRRARGLTVLAIAPCAMVVPELVALNFPMAREYMRLNMVFKFGYELYFFLPVLVSLAAMSGVRMGRRWVLLGLGLLTPFVGLSCWSHMGAWRSRIDRVKISTESGLSWLRESDPNEYALYQYLATLSPSERLLESCGMPPECTGYCQAGRMAAYAGIAGLCGWGQHVSLHSPRMPDGQETWQILQKVKALEEKVYTFGGDAIGAVALAESLSRWNVELIVVGAEEISSYPQLEVASLRWLGDIIWQRGRYGVIRVRD